MKGSGLTEDRKRAKRAGQTRETSDLNFKQRNQVEEGAKEEETSSCVHDLEAPVEESLCTVFLPSAQCENCCFIFFLFMPEHTPVQTNDICSSIILLVWTLIEDI